MKAVYLMTTIKTRTLSLMAGHIKIDRYLTIMCPSELSWEGSRCRFGQEEPLIFSINSYYPGDRRCQNHPPLGITLVGALSYNIWTISYEIEAFYQNLFGQ